MKQVADILLSYQRRWVGDKSRVRVWEKSRRIGASWCEAFMSVMEAAKSREAGGQDTFYLSYNKEMTQTFIRDCAYWAKAFNLLADEEKGGLGPPFFQAVQQALRGAPPGAVVKGQGHVLLPRRNFRPSVRGHCLSARQAQGGQKGQYENWDNLLHHRAVPPYLSGVSMRSSPGNFIGKITKRKSALS